MPQVSKNLLGKEIRDRLPRLLTESLRSCGSENRMEKLLLDLLTPTEEIMLGKRIAIAVLLLKEYDYRSISNLIKVSTTTVNRVANLLKTGEGGLEEVARKQIEKQEWKKFLSDAGRLFLKLNRPLKHYSEKPQPDL